MLTITLPSEEELVNAFAGLTVDAREFRFWDHYCTINTGEHGKTQREIYRKKVDAHLKKMKLGNEKRLAVIEEILKSKSI